ncbi:TCR/Tet family MFS transporter [Hyphobacterium sp. HN65]|uniref:TCR/Tet family MFS transporter n=1 Tax=Hyphobacterium lacteum TaxID=3116575 RepID=A0ABU7LSX9_9PROT|nr:TCR/Tet family MFS transporter [Hyphobacterium sp. HN65]MEE2526689.1 TCR/Tet family MFS transporter [Hyphobacterium sp. HN65]
MSRKPGRHALAFIFITVLVDMIGLGIIIPVLPQLIMDLTGLEEPRAILWGGALATLYAFMQFVCAPIVGNLSDRFGRRPVLMFSLAGFSIDYLVMGLAPYLWVLFIGRALSGLFGATYTTAGAFIADVSPAHKRGANFALIGAAFGLGFTIGPVIGGFLGAVDHRLPFFVAAGLGFANLIYGFLVLPETLAPENRRPFRFRNANPFGAMLQMRQFPIVFGLLGAFALFYLGHASLPTVWSYYGPYKFGWTELEVGISLGVVGVTTAFVQGFLARKAIPMLGPKRAAVIGFTIAAAAYWGYALAPNSLAMYTVIVLGALAGIGGPAIQGIMSNQVPANMQGALSGSTTSLSSLMTVFGPGLMSVIFNRFAASDASFYFPGAPFALAGVLTLVAVVIIARVIGRHEVAA